MKKKFLIYISFIPTLAFLSYLIFGPVPVLGAASATNQPLHYLEKNGAWGKTPALDLVPILPEESRQILNAEILDPGPADLKVEVNTIPSTLWVDSPFTYFITVTNLGTEPSYTVTLTDTLDVSLNLSVPWSSQGSCSEAYDMVCNLLNINPDGIVTVTMIVTPTAVGTITNTAVITSTTLDPDLDNNQFPLTSTIDPTADLSITKEDSADPVLVGDSLIYTLTVHNAGPYTATEVTLTDTLPISFEVAGASTPLGPCDVTGPVICSLGDIAAEDSITATISVTPTASGTFTNTAIVDSPVHDPNDGDNRADEATTVDPVADLSITKTDSADPVLVGDSLTYTLTVHNAGPSIATTVTLTDTLPITFTVAGASTPLGPCSVTGPVICSLGNINAGDDITATISVTPTASGTFTNTATVGSPVHDPNDGDNHADEATTVDPAADLDVDLSTDAETLLNNTPFTYTLLVTNLGPDTAYTATLTDTLQGSLDYALPTTPQGDCFVTSPFQFQCNLGNLEKDASATVTMVVTPTAAGTITNTAGITSSIYDPDDSNNTPQLVSSVEPLADLYVLKSHQPEEIYAGQTIHYEITVGNSGPDDAVGVVLTDTLPNGLEVDWVDPIDDCTQEPPIICNLGTITTDSPVTVDIFAVTTAGDTLTNTVEVSTTTAELYLDDNENRDTAEVIPAADLEVTKRVQPSEVSALIPITYTVEVTNQGPDIAYDITLTDTLQGPLELASLTAPQWGCEGTNPFSCDLDSLGIGDSAMVTLVVTPTAVGTITNTAEITSTTHDSVTGTNTALLVSTVAPSADLVLDKTHQPETVFADSVFTYTLEVTNQGPYSATGIVLTDWLPPEVDFVKPIYDKGNCSGTETVTCDLPELLMGEHWEVTLVVTATHGGALTNDASVWADTADPDPADNTISYPTTVLPTADLAISKTVSDEPVYLEEPLTYTVTITNLGPDPAEGVTLTDTLEGSLDYATPTASNGECSETNPFNCNLGELLSGDSVTVTMVVTPTAVGTITNTAVASSDTNDFASGNDEIQVFSTVIPNADLSITKTSSADNILVEDSLTYTLTVHNAGPSIATDISLVDTLPTGLTYTGYTPTEYDCTHDGVVTFSCNFPAMLPGESIQVAVHMYAPDDGIFENSAVVSSSVGESDLDDNTDDIITTVDPVADLYVAKSHKPSEIYAGQIIFYEITVGNDGPDDAEGVTLTDDLPNGLVIDWVDPSQGYCPQWTPVIICNLGTISTGTIESVDIAAWTTGATTSLVNTVEVATVTAERDLDDNDATDTTQVFTAADLILTKTAEPEFVYPSNPLTYTLTVFNDGPERAYGVVLTDTLPTGVISPSLDLSPGTAEDCDFYETSRELVCDLGDMNDNATATLTIWVTVDEADEPGTLTNKAEVASSTYDTKPSNNTKEIDTDVYLPADLEVIQVGSPDILNAQELLTYTITITNHGPAEATNATLVDDLDPLMAFESWPPDCIQNDQQVTCALGNLGVDESTSLSIIASTIPTSTGGTISNTVTVSSDLWDPEFLDNTAVVSATFLSDTVHPYVEWIAPEYTEGYTWVKVYGEWVTLVVTATDDIEIDYVKFYNREVWDYYDNSDDVWYDVAILEEPPFEFDLLTLSLAPSWNQMNVEAWDTAGNRAPISGVYYIYLEFIPPEGYTKVYIPIVVK